MPPQRINFRQIVVDIVAVMAGFVIVMWLLLPDLRSHPGGKKAIAINDIVQLCTAVEAYRTDYGVYPVDPNADWKDRAIYDFPGANHHNFELINVLRADGTDPGPNQNNALNKSKTVYLDVTWVKDSALPNAGLGRGNESDGRNIKIPGEWYDPWGNPYIFIIDMTGKGISDLSFVYSDPGLAAPKSIQPPVGIVGFSFGRDGKAGDNGNRVFSDSDDILYYKQPGRYRINL